MGLLLLSIAFFLLQGLAHKPADLFNLMKA
jgi:hypothetical protein